MTWYERIIAAHRAVTDAVSHAARVKSERYFVWQEDGSNDLAGDNGHGERAVTGTTDLYTKQELDPWADALGESYFRSFGTPVSILRPFNTFGPRQSARARLR